MPQTFFLWFHQVPSVSYQSVWHQTHYDVTNKNNNTSVFNILTYIMSVLTFKTAIIISIYMYVCMYVFVCRLYFITFFLHTFHKWTIYIKMIVICYWIGLYGKKINTTGVISGAGTAYPSEAPEFIPGF